MPSTDLSDIFFRNPSDLPADIAKKLITPDASENDSRVLTSLGWEGQTIGYVSVILSADGSSVSRAQFNVRGKLASDTISFQAAKLWPKVHKEVMVNIEPMNGSTFRFLGGTMCSDYVAQEAFKVTISRGEEVCDAGEARRLGIGDMCFRLLAHLDKTSNARQGPGPHWKLTVLAFPHTIEDLEDSEQLAQHTAWPGIKIVEEKAEFFPRADAAPWGCPIFPLLSVENRSAAVNTIPSGGTLRAAIAGVCRSATLPTSCTSRSGLLKKIQEINSGDPDEFSREPSVRWPASNMPPPDEGK
jgi:hypothetical protein